MALVINTLIQQLSSLDIRALRWLLTRKLFPQLAICGRVVSRSADGYLYPLIALALLFLGTTHEYRFGLAMLLAFAVERPLYKILKEGFKRNRPSECLPDIKGMVVPGDQFSFPSGHTSAAFLVATVLTSCFPGTAPFIYIWAALVACSRVCLGVHFPSDTFAGAILGFSCAQLAFALIL